MKCRARLMRGSTTPCRCPVSCLVWPPATTIDLLAGDIITGRTPGASMATSSRHLTPPLMHSRHHVIHTDVCTQRESRGPHCLLQNCVVTRPFTYKRCQVSENAILQKSIKFHVLRDHCNPRKLCHCFPEV